MCMSVPQIAVLRIWIRTSLAPSFGSGISLSQIPGARSAFTSAFICSTPRSASNTKLAAGDDKCFDRPVELTAIVSRAHLGAYARLTHRHDGKGKADHIHAMIEETVGEPCRERGVAQHHGHDRVLARHDVEPGVGHVAAEVLRVLGEPRAQLCAVLDEIEHAQGRRGYHRR